MINSFLPHSLGRVNELYLDCTFSSGFVNVFLIRQVNRLKDCRHMFSINVTSFIAFCKIASIFYHLFPNKHAGVLHFTYFVQFVKFLLEEFWKLNITGIIWLNHLWWNLLFVFFQNVWIFRMGGALIRENVILHYGTVCLQHIWE